MMFVMLVRPERDFKMLKTGLWVLLDRAAYNYVHVVMSICVTVIL